MHNCNFCDKEFNILEQLGNHVMKTHVPTGEVRLSVSVPLFNRKGIKLFTRGKPRPTVKKDTL